MIGFSLYFKQINLLEADFGVKLFEPTYRGLILTKAGLSLYHDARYVIQYYKDSVIRAKNAMQEEDNVIRIGTSPMTPDGVLVELWPKIHELCPEINPDSQSAALFPFTIGWSGKIGC